MRRRLRRLRKKVIGLIVALGKSSGVGTIPSEGGVSLSERKPMLLPYSPPRLDSIDIKLFDTLVPFDHWVRRADKHIDFLALRQAIEPLFSGEGRPAIEPVLFIKLEFLMFHDCLSYSQVFERAGTDLAYRHFLGLGREDHLPSAGSLRKFRARLGVEGHQAIFDKLVSQARACGLVKDRLRLKDATHVLADIAIPAGLQLVAQARNKLLVAAEPFDATSVAGERVRIESVRTTTDTCGSETRLVARVEHLRDLVAWVAELPPPSDANENPTWKKLVAALDVARKVLAGHDRPDAPGKIRSAVDPDARRGRHGEFYDGYMVDALIDADSELFTAINVMPANGNESADTLTLLDREQSAHGNQIEKLSIDGAGYDGPVIRELESKNVKVFVPPKETTNRGRYRSDEFHLNEDNSSVTCPAGEQSQYKQRDQAKHTTSYRFNREACHACPLKQECIDTNQKFGRSVRKNDYEPEYSMVRARAQTTEYAEVKREHPRVERRLGELINRHGGRRARYRGTNKVFVQQILGATTANLKRMIRLLDAGSVFSFG